MRLYDPPTDGPLRGVVGTDELHPPLLPHAFGALRPAAAGDGVALHGGYLFMVFLPDATAGGATLAVAELSSGGSDGASLPDSDNCERLWCIFAWPAVHGPESERAFFLNHEGVLLATANRDGGYEGLLQVPAFDAALSDETGGGDMKAPLGITAVLQPLGHAANDGRTWVVASPAW
jgi:hypothetical protein